MKRILTLSLLMLTLCATAMAQINFTVSYKRVSPTEIDIVFNGTADAGWHIYSTNLPADGPNPAIFGVDKQSGVELVGTLKPGSGAKTEFDAMFGMDITFFENSCTFTQRVRLTQQNYSLEGYLEYSACNDQSCLPPTAVECKLAGNDGPGAAATASTKTATPKAEEKAVVAEKKDEKAAETPLTPLTEAAPATAAAATTTADVPAALGSGNWWKPVVAELEAFGQEDIGKQALWYIFILGFVGGLIALFTPCVWPIIPMTVSFFLKRSGDRKKGIRDAITYGISIVVIYVSLGVLITFTLGASALNDLSTNAVFNLLFCLMLVVFAASFFGGFEIALPSSWGAAVDGKAEKTTGLLSIFLMAFTLALVSFSCTGPIIGFLLVEMATSGDFVAPIIGMLGFAIALALPFTLFALFPTWLKSAPKSGGWLNMVKVTLGFLELAFALKFLSVADLAYGWHILDRETFLAIWIILFALLGIYLLGFIKFPHDDPDERQTSVPRFFLALASLSFALYMVPGLWGAPCKAISAFAPPMYTQDFNLAPAKVEPFLDYEEGMEYARKSGKPVIVDFTGHGCVNCRKMESAVWEHNKVVKYLTDDYVIISLYVDEKAKLAEPITVVEDGTERKLRTVGDKWSYLQRMKFGGQTQPFYVLVDNEGNPLNSSYSYDEDVDKFVNFLETGLKNYKK